MILGAITGSFGLIAGITLLFFSPFHDILAGVFVLGVAPFAAGGLLLWSGLEVFDRHDLRSRVDAIPDAQIIRAALGGATVEMIARRLGLSDIPGLTDRLDQMAAHEILDLRVSEEGVLLYEPRFHAGA